MNPNRNQGRDRPPTKFEQRVGLIFMGLVLLALLSGCGTIDMNTRYTQHDMPAVGEHNVCLRVTLTPSVLEANTICRREFGLGGVACAELPRADGMPQRLIAPAPANWNDATAIFLLGHELLHNLGGRHE